MSRLKGTATAAVRWVGAEIAPLVLLPLAAVLVWVSVWKVWLPSPDAGTPSRRSGTLAILLLVLGGSAPVLAVFPHRLRPPRPCGDRAPGGGCGARRPRRAARPEGRRAREGRRGDPPLPRGRPDDPPAGEGPRGRRQRPHGRPGAGARGADRRANRLSTLE